MIDKLTRGSKAAAWARIARALLVVALLGSAIGIAPARSSASAHVHATLLQAAAQKPDSTVNVIVQKTVKDNSVEQAVAHLGGKVTKDLHIINAFAAHLPAKNVTKLATTQGVRWISPDARMTKTASGSGSMGQIDATRIENVYPRVIRADQLWNAAPNYNQGQNVAVAIIDTGITPKPDLMTGSNNNTSRITFSRTFFTSTTSTSDGYGHGTHIAGLVGSNGFSSGGAYVGVAPRVNLVNLRVGDTSGAANASDVVEAMQWIYDNHDQYNVRVLNLSLSSSVPESYMESPLDAAVEILWFSGIVVVASAGNSGPNSMLFAPGNDPFVITVGATDDQGTLTLQDDVLAPYSSYGLTQDGFTKPDIVAPGTDLISLLSSSNATIVQGHQDHLVQRRGNTFLRLSGTSMAAGVLSGAIALLLADEPNLNPDQVKFRLMATAARTGVTSTTWPAYNPVTSGSGYLNIQSAVNGTTTATANTGTIASQLLWTGDDPIDWQSVNWGSVNWGSVNWGSVNWGSVNWGSVNWGSVYWEP